MDQDVRGGPDLVFDILRAGSGVVRELFLRSDYSSPEEIRPEIANFEKAAKTLRVRLVGPEDGLWTVEFTDLEREIRPASGEFERYYFNIKPIFDGRLWDVWSDVGYDVFQKTIDRLVSFLSKLEHAFIPPKFIERIVEERELVHQIRAFSARRDYFTVHVSSNPGTRVVGDSADLRLKSTNASRDFEIMVKKDRPIGPLVLHSMDLELKRGDAECRARIASDGFLSQVGRGERDLYLGLKGHLLRFFEEQDEWVKSMPRVQTEEIEDREHALKFESKKIVQFGKPFVLNLSFELDRERLLKLRGLFTSNFHQSQFIGTIEREVPDKSFTVRTTDLRGGGDAILGAELGSRTASITPLVTTKIRTLERIYKVVLEKFDVDADLVGPKS